MSDFQLAQINIALARDELTSIRMRGFVARLDEINALADRAPGFVWRLQSEDGNAMSFKVFDNPRLIVNMSVWESLESLQAFVYKTTHAEVMGLRNRWFDKLPGIHQALWWIPAQQYPSVDEGKEKLDQLAHQGPGPEAFTFARPFPKPGPSASQI